MTDLHGHEYSDLLEIQAKHLDAWSTRLLPTLFAEVKAYVLKHNQAASEKGRHQVYRGMDITLIIYQWPHLCSAYPPIKEDPTDCI